MYTNKNHHRMAAGLLALIFLLTSCAPPTSSPPPENTFQPAPTSAWTPPPAPPESAACTHFVAPGGEDGNSGSEAQPWATFQRSADAAQPGDTVCFREGIYSIDEGISLARSGSPDLPITFTAAPGETPILDGGNQAGGILTLEPGVSHLRISGFVLRDFRNWGITVLGDNQHISLGYLSISGGEAGVHFTLGYSGETPRHGPVSDILFENSVISGSIYTAVDCTPGPCDRMTFRGLEIFGSGMEAGFGGDGLAVEQGQNILVEDCYIHDNGGDGIDLNSRDAPGSVSGILVRRNRVAGNLLNGLKLWAGGEAVNNLIWDSGDTALVLEGGSSYTILNNTIANATSYTYLASLGGFETSSLPTDLNLFNNIFYNDNPEMGGTLVYFAEGVNLIADHNLYYNPFREEDVICAHFLGEEACFSNEQINNGAWFAQSGQGEHSFYDDPLFQDASAKDFHLSSGSPAINAGRAGELPLEDLDGLLRDAYPDLGAYEWQEVGAWVHSTFILVNDLFQSHPPLISLRASYCIIRAEEHQCQ